jgi:hypothetical protein
MKYFETRGLEGYKVVQSNGDIKDQFITSGYNLDLFCEEVSDGYHTFSELYEHRYALFCALVKVYDAYKTPLGSSVTCWKSKLHSDGTMFENSFIVQMVVRKLDGTKQQISYHLPLSWWDEFTCMSIDKAWEWDGHTSKDVIERLLRL